MKSTKSVTNMSTGDVITKRQPHTLVKINDNSAREIPKVSTFDYSVLQVIYSDKGITDQFIRFEGDNVLDKFDKMFGNLNTAIYGPMGLYARRALEAGFRLNVLNVAPKDAKHANFHVAWRISQKKLGTANTPQTITVFAQHDTSSDSYTFAKTREELVAETGEIKEITIPLLQFGFEAKYVQDCNKTYDPEEFLGKTDIRTTLPEDGDLTKVDINIPVFGLFYEGATDYGNNFSFNVTDNGNKINDKYPFYAGNIMDKNTIEHQINFTLFNIQQNNISTSFKDQITKTAQVLFTDRNVVKLFRPFMVTRKSANLTKKIVPAALKLVADALIAKIKTVLPAFNPDASTSNIQEIIGPTTDYVLYYKTRDDEIGRTLETPFSTLTPWKKIDTTETLIEHTSCPMSFKLEGGSSGKLKDILNEEEFDWNIKYPNETTPIFEEMFINAYSGKTDPAIFDQALVPDSMLFGDSYPLKVQETIAELTRYREDVAYFDKSRPDFSYYRTPGKDVGNDFNQVLNWVESWKTNIPQGKNVRVKPTVGRASFEDPTTGGQSVFELVYDYLGPNSSLAAYLKSGTSSPFASDSWSDIVSAVPGTYELIPGDEEREALSRKDVNYYRRKSDGVLALGEDTAMYLDHISGLKNNMTTVHFNRIINVVTLIARDNPITNPTKENLDAIVRKMLAAAGIAAKHFGNTLTITPKISTLEMEKNLNVVVYDVDVNCPSFSRHNRVVFNANAADAV